MKFEIIGRDPILTYKITQMIGERAERNRIKRARIDAIKKPFAVIKQLLKP